MKLTLGNPIYTTIAIASLEKVMKDLAATKQLQHVWVVEEVKTNLKFSQNDEVGVVIYPCRRTFLKRNIVPVKEKRIVMKPLPCGTKVKAKFLEIGFGDGLSRDPLLGVKDCPVKKMVGGDGKYVKDFFLIINSLTEILTNMGGVITPERKEKK